MTMATITKGCHDFPYQLLFFSFEMFSLLIISFSATKPFMKIAVKKSISIHLIWRHETRKKVKIINRSHFVSIKPNWFWVKKRSNQSFCYSSLFSFMSYFSFYPVFFFSYYYRCHFSSTQLDTHTQTMPIILLSQWKWIDKKIKDAQNPLKPFRQCSSLIKKKS